MNNNTYLLPYFFTSLLPYFLTYFLTSLLPYFLTSLLPYFLTHLLKYIHGHPAPGPTLRRVASHIYHVFHLWSSNAVKNHSKYHCCVIMWHFKHLKFKSCFKKTFKNKKRNPVLHYYPFVNKIEHHYLQEFWCSPSKNIEKHKKMIMPVWTPNNKTLNFVPPTHPASFQ